MVDPGPRSFGGAVRWGSGEGRAGDGPQAPRAPRPAFGTGRLPAGDRRRVVERRSAVDVCQPDPRLCLSTASAVARWLAGRRQRPDHLVGSRRLPAASRRRRRRPGAVRRVVAAGGARGGPGGAGPVGPRCSRAPAGSAGGAAEMGGLTVATGLYEAALGCWRGPVLADAEPGFERLPVVVDANQRRITSIVEYAELCGTLGRHEPAVEALRGASKIAPLHEGLHAQLMLA